MPQGNRTSTAPAVPTLVEGVVSDAGQLIEQQFQLLREELKGELEKVRGAAISLGTGAGLAAAGGLLGMLATVHLVQRVTRLPLWAAYGLVGGLLGTAGAALLTSGVSQASGVRLIPPRTAATLQRDFTTLKDRVTSGA